MTPAIDCAKKAKIEYRVHQYAHDKSSTSYGKEAAEKLNLSDERVFKTLVACIDGKELVVAVVPVAQQLSFKSLASCMGAKKSTMAAPREVERATGYVLGGVSPLGQKIMLRTAVDESALSFESIYVSAGRRGVEIELAPRDLAGITSAIFASISQ